MPESKAEPDAKFSPDTKQIIASRAGYRCSFPDCDRSTIGPGRGPTDVENTGTAAHIFSASTGPRGPRGTGGLSVEERKSAANGIWMCRNHGALIDNEKGKNYPASTLQAWKALQEERIAREMLKLALPNAGWLESIVIERSPYYRPGATITLGKVTLLLGPNGFGKTALCEWLAGGADDARSLERWAGTGSRRHKVDLRLSILNPERHEFKVRFSGQKVSTRYDGRRAVDLKHALRIVYIHENVQYRRDVDDLEFLASVWGVHPYRVPRILKSVCSRKYGYIKSVKPIEDEKLDESDESRPVRPEVSPEIERQRAGRRHITLQFKIGEHKEHVSFNHLASRERSQVMVSGAMVIADEFARFQNTLLILELGGQLLPDELLSRYTQKLQRSDFPFQTLVVSPMERPKVDWTGWSVARLVGARGDACINQEEG